MALHTACSSLAILMLTVAVGCSGRDATQGTDGKAAATQEPASGGPVKQENTPASLKALIQQLHQAQQKANHQQAAELTRALLPDEARLKLALRDEAPADAIQAILGLNKQYLAAPEAGQATILMARTEQTEVQVHGATTEELSQYADGSTAAAQFPKMARTAAQKLLRPGATFYMVECRQPGTKLATRFEMFYWDGKQWTWLGPVWSILRWKE